jgi:peptidoglycan hydrolase CwlO-like protein
MDEVKKKMDHYNRMISNEEAIMLEVQDREEHEIEDLQRQIHETDRKIMDRKEEIDQTDSNID